jgi:hypothetical protein
MDAQDLHNLQEAYMGVYEEVDTRRAPKELLDRLNSSREGHMAQDGPNRPAYDARQRLLKKAHKRKEQKEQTDLYDIILSHLLDEGYADTQEQAEVIMVNMSEDWRESICEGMKSIIDKKFPNRKYKIGIPDRNIEPDVIEDPETGYPVKKNKLRKLTRDEQKRKNS